MSKDIMGKFVLIKMPSGNYAVTEDKNQTNLIAICPVRENAIIIRDVYNSLRRQMIDDVAKGVTVEELVETAQVLETALTKQEKSNAQDSSSDDSSDDAATSVNH